jgi:hypothetical protein
MLRIQKVRDGEDAIGPSRTGVNTRDACATQVLRNEGLYHSGFVILMIRSAIFSPREFVVVRALAPAIDCASAQQADKIR